jgi:hypothetical protein
VGAGSLVALAAFGPPDGRDFTDVEVTGAFALAGLGLGADVWFRYMTSHPLPSLDRVLYAIDESLGWQASFAAGALFHRVPALAIASEAVYQWLPVWLGWMFVRLPREVPRLRVTWAAAAAGAGAIGYLAYRWCPAAGPKYAFPELYPSVLPNIGPGWAQPVEMTTSLLNAFPSLHTAWALLLLLWAPALRTTTERVLVVVVSTVTVLATLGLGEHYVIDLVGAVPFAAAIESLCTMTSRNWRSRLATAALDTAIFLCWIAGIRTAAILGLAPGTIRLLMAATVVLPAAEPLVRLARRRRHHRIAPLPVLVPADIGADAVRRP